MEILQPAESPVTFEQFMAGMQKLSAFQEETARQLRETDAIVKETQEKVWQMQETDKQFNRYSDLFEEEYVEYLDKLKVMDKFYELGFVFNKAYRYARIEDKKNDIEVNIDITLENRDQVMIIDAQFKLLIYEINDYINECIARMKKVRRHADLHQDKRKYLGAVVGMIFNEQERKFALEKGFYVIEPSGDTFTIIEPKGQYGPREW